MKDSKNKYNLHNKLESDDFRSNSFNYLRIENMTGFLLNYRNMSGSLGEREMLREHEPQATSVSSAFLSSPKHSQVFL